MAESKRDDNLVPTLLGTSNSDGSTPVLIKADPTSHGISIDDNSTGSDLSGDVASRDNNGVVVFLAVSSVDGSTPVAVYANPSTGKLLVKST